MARSPLAANADEDDEDGDDKRRRGRNGPKQQQALVVALAARVRRTVHLLSITHSHPRELNRCHTDCLLGKTCRRREGRRDCRRAQVVVGREERQKKTGGKQTPYGREIREESEEMLHRGG